MNPLLGALAPLVAPLAGALLVVGPTVPAPTVPAQQPTAVLVVDSSGSMGRAGTDAARRAARGYARSVGAGVRVGLVAFSDRAEVLAPPTTDRAVLDAGLDRLVPRGETALYDALALAAGQAGVGGNIVVLSDGGDTRSVATLDAALAAVTGRRLRADVIAFRTAESDRVPLERIAAAGHGRVLAAEDAAGLGRAFAGAAAAVPSGRPSAVPTTAAPKPTVPTAVPTAVPAGRVAAPPRWLRAEAIGGAVAGVLGVAVVLLAWPQSRAELDRRRRALALAAYSSTYSSTVSGTGSDQTGPDSPGGPGSVVSHLAATLLRACEQLVGAGGRRAAIALRLDRAGLTLLPQEWVALRASAVAVAGAGGLLLVRPHPVGLALGAALGWALPGFWSRGRAGRRCRAFAEQLPDTLQTVASSLRSGFSLQQALAATQETAPLPMASELGRALAAARIGVVLEDELDQIAVRMRSDDWHLAVMAIRIQRSVGGNLSEVLATTARTLRDRSAVVRQVRALSAEGRLSAYVLLGLPVGVGLFLVAFRRPYIEPLWTTHVGIGLLVAAGIGMAVGTAWMFRVAEVEV